VPLPYIGYVAKQLILPQKMPPKPTPPNTKSVSSHCRPPHFHHSSLLVSPPMAALPPYHCPLNMTPTHRDTGMYLAHAHTHIVPNDNEDFHNKNDSPQHTHAHTHTMASVVSLLCLSTLCSSFFHVLLIVNHII
jgi:hypothetical protein